MKRGLPKASFRCEALLSYQENEGICYENFFLRLSCCLSKVQSRERLRHGSVLGFRSCLGCRKLSPSQQISDCSPKQKVVTTAIAVYLRRSAPFLKAK